jgi:hypothetical protein
LRIASKISLLSAILIADLLFFMFASNYYPEMLQLILVSMPGEDALEEAIMIILGLIIAVLSSVAIIYILVKSVQKEG